MNLIALLIGALVTARLTRLVTSDRITEAPRNWLLRRLDPQGLAAYFVVCPWCVSVYAGLGVAGAGTLTGQWTWPWIVPLALAYSYLAGFLATKEGE
jgi:hypothetical protein